MISYFSIDRDELQELVHKARVVAIVLLSELIEKSFIIYATALESGLNRIEQNIRVKNGYVALNQISQLCKDLETALSIPRHPKSVYSYAIRQMKCTCFILDSKT